MMLISGHDPNGSGTNEALARPSVHLKLRYLEPEQGSKALIHRVHVAHAVIASTTMIILFPTVAIILRVISSPYIVTLHWVLQLVNLFILLVAFGLGCWLSVLHGFVSLQQNKEDKRLAGYACADRAVVDNSLDLELRAPNLWNHHRRPLSRPACARLLAASTVPEGGVSGRLQPDACVVWTCGDHAGLHQRSAGDCAVQTWIHNGNRIWGGCRSHDPWVSCESGVLAIEDSQGPGQGR
jgi:hypothetical protein